MQVLQLLQQSDKYMGSPTDVIAALLVLVMQLDVNSQQNKMSALSNGLLLIWQQFCTPPWMQQLSAEAASLLAVLLNREERWPETSALFEIRANTKQVDLHG